MPRVGVDGLTRAEGDAVTQAMTDPTVKAMTVISGLLLDLTLPQRRAVISFLISTCDHHAATAPTPLRLHNGGAGTPGDSTGA
jgi:hypothetical protein